MSDILNKILAVKTQEVATALAAKPLVISPVRSGPKFLRGRPP